MTDQFCQSQVQDADTGRSGITHAEIDRMVVWDHAFGHQRAEASFVAAWDGPKLLFARLIRVQRHGVGLGRKEAFVRGQNVALWEQHAEDALRAGVA